MADDAWDSSVSRSQKKALRRLSALLHGLPDEAAIDEFLRGLLTPQELKQIPQRLAILELLKQGVPQREIAGRLGVGIATVTRGAREMKQSSFVKCLK